MFQLKMTEMFKLKKPALKTIRWQTCFPHLVASFPFLLEQHVGERVVESSGLVLKCSVNVIEKAND